MKMIDCTNQSAAVELRIGDVVWTGFTTYALATVLILCADEIETQIFSDQQERISVPLASLQVDRIVGALIESKLRDLKKKGSGR